MPSSPCGELGAPGPFDDRKLHPLRMAPVVGLDGGEEGGTCRAPRVRSSRRFAGRPDKRHRVRCARRAGAGGRLAPPSPASACASHQATLQEIPRWRMQLRRRRAEYVARPPFFDIKTTGYLCFGRKNDPDPRCGRGRHAPADAAGPRPQLQGGRQRCLAARFAADGLTFRAAGSLPDTCHRSRTVPGRCQEHVVCPV